jgi:hypothetical protein
MANLKMMRRKGILSCYSLAGWEGMFSYERKMKVKWGRVKERGERRRVCLVSNCVVEYLFE